MHTWQSLLQNSSGILSSSELNRVPLMHLKYLLHAHLAEYFLTEHPIVLPSVSSLHLLNTHLAELSESLVILT
jgi:hypothetical protein